MYNTFDRMHFEKSNQRHYIKCQSQLDVFWYAAICGLFYHHRSIRNRFFSIPI